MLNWDIFQTVMPIMVRQKAYWASCNVIKHCCGQCSMLMTYISGWSTGCKTALAMMMNTSILRMRLPAQLAQHPILLGGPQV